MSRKSLLASFVLSLMLISYLVFLGCDNDPSSDNLFEKITAEHSGIRFNNRVTEKYDDNILRSEYFYNGGGLSAGDINNDGLIDLYFVSNQGDNKLFLNKGNFKFEDITARAGVKGHDGWASASAMIDVNHDGFLDIYVGYSRTTKPGETKNQLFINRQNTTFIEGALLFGLHKSAITNQSAFLDYDLDGDLDMYMANHLPLYPNLADTLSLVSKRNPQGGDIFLKNNQITVKGEAQDVFHDVTEEVQIQSHALGFGLGVGVGDLNQDGFPDIYVGNDFLDRDYLYLNNRKGRFIEGSDEALAHMSNFSMGNDIADINNDGLLDIVSLDMANDNNYETKTDMSGMDPKGFYDAVNKGFHYQYMHNTLQLNMGNGMFSEIARIAKIDATNWSWAPLFADFDNDGFKDLFVSNGFRRNFRNKDFQKYYEKKYHSKKWTKTTFPHFIKEALERIPIKHVPNRIFKNSDGLRFDDKTVEWGLDIPSFSNGAVYADLDNDGDLDIVVNNIDEDAMLFRNDISKTSDANFLKIKLRGPERNKLGLGTKLTIYTPDGQQQFVEHYMVRGYRSSMPNEIHFGLGKNKKIDSIHVHWSTNKAQTLYDIEANQKIELFYKDASEIEHDSLKKKKTIFKKDTFSDYGVDFTHKEISFDDYAKQILLPHKYSQLGPGIAVADVNKDGLDDFYVGGAAGFAGRLYLQKTDKSFVEAKGPWEKHKEREDVDALFFDANNDGYMDLYIVSGGNEWVHGSDQYLDRLYINHGQGTFEDASGMLPRLAASGSIITTGDYDNDGDIDLFIGGRLIAQQYPLLASGHLLRNEGGTFKNVSDEIAPGLKEIGLITDAKWLDIDTDGDEDLVVVGEWMGISVFINDGGRLHISDIYANTFKNTEGWWASVDFADFDRDGDMDIVAGNIGLNHKYKASAEEPFEVFSSDFDDNGALDIILGFHQKDALYPLRGRECSSDQMPYIKKKFPNYKSFAQASIQDVVGETKLKKALNLKARTFATTYFENLGGGNFKAKELPFLAQISNVNDMEIGDFDRDGNLDIVAIGNMHHSEVETTRNDASFGVLLLGNGKGSFQQKFPYESGLYANGDTKKIKSLRIGGRKYLIVAENDNPLQLWKTIDDGR